ncbi:MAG: glycolate oxidase subunit GlcE [Burkholderiaceae bacterium]|nr:MAG: glycolate oxidase subunit GlcE [Burkholderiaceae bacterium]
MPRTKRSSIETAKPTVAPNLATAASGPHASEIASVDQASMLKAKKKSKAAQDNSTSKSKTKRKPKDSKAEEGLKQDAPSEVRQEPTSSIRPSEEPITQTQVAARAQPCKDGTDMLKTWREQIQEARAQKAKLRIVGGKSKSWYGNAFERTNGQENHQIAELCTEEYVGVIEYEPSELYVQVRAGTPLQELTRLLKRHGQMLAFEPPLFGLTATVGGMLACGLSGPRRAYAAAMKDHVLGVGFISGRAELLRFGTKVIKNVAGYDVSRLMVGSRASLGVITDVTLKVIPLPQVECSLVFAASEQDAMQMLQRWAGQCLPISASCYYAGRLTLRLSGLAEVVKQTHQKLGGVRIDGDDAFWESLREQQHHFFHAEPELSLWRLSLPSTAPVADFRCKTLLEWGGAQRWVWTLERPETVRSYALKHRGHATLFRSREKDVSVFTPVSAAQSKIQERICTVFDPDGIFDLGQWRS